MGNFSQDPKDVLQDALRKGYTRVRFQQGKPLLDRELNLLGDLASPQRLVAHYFGNGVPDDSNSFRISGLNVAQNDFDFTIEAGRCLVGGYEVVLGANTTYKTQPHTENVTISLPSETSNVYLRVFSSEITGAEDPSLLNSGDVGFETAVREKVEWEVLVTSAEITTPDHFLLATLDKNTVEDRRRTVLALATIRDKLFTQRTMGSFCFSEVDANGAKRTIKTDFRPRLLLISGGAHALFPTASAADFNCGFIGGSAILDENGSVIDQCVIGPCIRKYMTSNFQWMAESTQAVGYASFHNHLTPPFQDVLLQVLVDEVNDKMIRFRLSQSHSFELIKRFVIRLSVVILG